ncbi:MAG: hypothetical protein LBF40_06190 [Deltaproteobacteria bacterium]|jgi:hypothetical protein|nr:hypothetical protein [Deltaproteobacteria bacterium]
MNADIVSDVPGRLRIRFGPGEMGPGDYWALSALIAQSEDVRNVTIGLLTGSLLILYDRDGAAREEIIMKILCYVPGEPEALLRKGKQLASLCASSSQANDPLGSDLTPNEQKVIFDRSGLKGLGLAKAAGLLKGLDYGIRALTHGKHGLLCLLFH